MDKAMTELFCSYGDDRDGAIVAFLYDDPDDSGAERARFELHLPACARCQAEIAALRGVRTQLARWSPPEPSFTRAIRQSNPQSADPQSTMVAPRPASGRRSRRRCCFSASRPASRIWMCITISAA